MSDAAPSTAAALATCQVADPASPSAAPRPFARPTPGEGERPTAPSRPSPFVAPPEPAAQRTRASAGDVEPTQAGGSAAEPPVGAPAQMAWPDAVGLDAAHTLDRVARRLRAGSLRLPVAVDPASPAAVLAALLAALHAEASADAAGRSA